MKEIGRYWIEIVELPNGPLVPNAGPTIVLGDVSVTLNGAMQAISSVGRGTAKQPESWRSRCARQPMC